MTNYFKLPTWADGDHVYAVVETPRGSRAKLEFDPKLGAFTLAKPLLAGLTYPYDWGFIPSTKAEDGDPLDVLIIHDAATYPGLVLTCKPIGVLEVLQSSKGRKERNDRVFGPFSVRGQFAGHTTIASEGYQGAGAVFRGNERARTEDTGIFGMARPSQGHQDDQEDVNLSGHDASIQAGTDVRASTRYHLCIFATILSQELIETGQDSPGRNSAPDAGSPGSFRLQAQWRFPGGVCQLVHRIALRGLRWASADGDGNRVAGRAIHAAPDRGKWRGHCSYPSKCDEARRV